MLEPDALGTCGPCCATVLGHKARAKFMKPLLKLHYTVLCCRVHRPQKVCTFSFIVGNNDIIQKSVRCIHSATKTLYSNYLKDPLIKASLALIEK